MLEFCPVCKKLLVLGEWRGKSVGKCSCGFIRTSGISVEGDENMENKSSLVGSGVSENQNKLAEGIVFSCKKCGFDKANAQSLGEILGNEKSVTLFTCLKCGNVERN